METDVARMKSRIIALQEEMRGAREREADMYVRLYSAEMGLEEGEGGKEPFSSEKRDWAMSSDEKVMLVVEKRELGKSWRDAKWGGVVDNAIGVSSENSGWHLFSNFSSQRISST